MSRHDTIVNARRHTTHVQSQSLSSSSNKAPSRRHWTRLCSPTIWNTCATRRHAHVSTAVYTRWGAHNNKENRHGQPGHTRIDEAHEWEYRGRVPALAVQSLGWWASHGFFSAGAVAGPCTYPGPQLQPAALRCHRGNSGQIQCSCEPSCLAGVGGGAGDSASTRASREHSGASRNRQHKHADLSSLAC